MTPILLSILVGLSIVSQGTLNRVFSSDFGLMTMALVNAIVFLIACFLLFLLTRFYPQFFPSFFFGEKNFIFQLKHIIPGLCGLVIVVFVPLAIRDLSAGKVFMTVIGSQLLFSVLLDMLYFGQTLSGRKILGLALSLLGAFLY